MIKAKVLTIGGQVRSLGTTHVYQHNKLVCKKDQDGAVYPLRG